MLKWFLPEPIHIIGDFTALWTKIERVLNQEIM